MFSAWEMIKMQIIVRDISSNITKEIFDIPFNFVSGKTFIRFEFYVSYILMKPYYFAEGMNSAISPSREMLRIKEEILNNFYNWHNN